MANKRKRKLRKEIKYALIGITIILIPLVMIFGTKYMRFMGDKSLNENAKKLVNNHCLAFYPKDGGNIAKNYAKKICEGIEDNSKFDYTMSELGDYYLIDYGSDKAYLLDKEMNEPKISTVSQKGKMMISDYLRYTMKSKGLDYAYTLNFLEKSYYENIKDDEYTMSIDGKNLLCHFNEYEVDVKIPLKYIGPEVGINIGSNENYIKPTYVDPERKAVALTFDDGPSLDEECTSKIINTLYRYDANASFYVLGSRLYEKTQGIIGDGILKGNEYGSHSCSHTDLRKLPKNEIYSEVMDVAVWLKDNFNYDMTTYRPPYGKYNALVDETVPVAAVFWNIDSNDWSYRDASKIYDEVKNNVFDRSVIIFHDIYSTTAQALDDLKLVEYLIDEGYQLITVDEMAKLRGVELKQGTHLCWGD